MSAEQLIGTIKQVKIHDSDPTTNQPDDPWDRASSQFGSLGERLKATYRKAADEGGPTEEEIKEAFSTLLGAWDRIAGSFADALRDQETREHLKSVASSLASALGATIADLGAEFSTDFTGPDSEEE